MFWLDQKTQLKLLYSWRSTVVTLWSVCKSQQNWMYANYFLLKINIHRKYSHLRLFTDFDWSQHPNKSNSWLFHSCSVVPVHQISNAVVEPTCCCHFHPNQHLMAQSNGKDLHLESTPKKLLGSWFVVFKAFDLEFGNE